MEMPFYVECKAGTTAKLDTFAGLVPCKVVEVITAGDGKSGNGKVRIKLTATVGAYEKGEILERDSASVIPNSHVKRGEFGYSLFTNYNYTVE